MLALSSFGKIYGVISIGPEAVRSVTIVTPTCCAWPSVTDTFTVTAGVPSVEVASFTKVS